MAAFSGRIQGEIPRNSAVGPAAPARMPSKKDQPRKWCGGPAVHGRAAASLRSPDGAQRDPGTRPAFRCAPCGLRTCCVLVGAATVAALMTARPR